MPNKHEVEQLFQIPEEIPLPKAEGPKEPEKALEKAKEEYKKVDEAKPGRSIYIKKQASTAPITKEELKSEVYQELEGLLAEGLEQVYLSLDEKQQAEFRRKGEETVSKLEKLIINFKVKAKTVLKLIKEWLLVIPKINKHFLEQESKLRTDKVMAVAKKYPADRQAGKK